MTAAALHLERFDRGASECGLARRFGVPSAARAGDGADNSAVADDGEVAPDESPGVEQPDSEPEVPAPDLAGILHSIDAQLSDLRQRLVHEIAEGFGRALMAGLPSLVDSRVAEEIAAATASLVHAGGLDGAVLAVSDEEHEAVVEALRSRAPPLPVEVTGERDVPLGTARLRWPGGGAEISAEALVAAARGVLEQRIGAASRRIEANDQFDQ